MYVCECVYDVCEAVCVSTCMCMCESAHVGLIVCMWVRVVSLGDCVYMYVRVCMCV